MGDKKPDRKPIPGWLNFVFGGMSGMMGICVVQPADLVKTRMQLMGPKGDKSVMTTVSGILKNEGVSGFYKGLSAALFRQATYTTARLGIFNSINDYYTSSHGAPSFPMKLVIGMVAGGLAAFVGNPAEVALIRMTADGRLPPDQRRNYKNVFNALSRIISEEGAATLFRGASATATRAMVVNGAQLGSYSQAREQLLPVLGQGIVLHFIASLISGLTTALASLPVDIVKTRVQNSAKGVNQFQVLGSIIKEEGVLTLWRGFIPTYAKMGPLTVLMFIFLEQWNALYYRLTE
ncbi:mitochondrial 2-oxoglutarate/malate carrier protein-like [Pararge aegeria]|uniref:Jg3684 protein n=1 Tax=Pararge aegeria aegeria TaxID=348720 RepID=A0A8S4S7F8_9NEOP|nr:mitochondrial 2-oxoglutarate/malate carrier protein-like [Pararge aegeria]CAH2246200.1 jg3684 [Pararge aegeria aegeria]